LCSLKEAGDQAWFSPDPLHGVAQFAPQMREMQATQVAQLDAFTERCMQKNWLRLLQNRPNLL
jgi:hypothetical protein